jgi:outer membrane protein
MRSIRNLTPLAALAGLLAVAPAAFAQDAGTDSASASGRHFTLVGGVAAQKATGSGIINGQRADFDSEAAPTLSASYNVNDNIAI